MIKHRFLGGEGMPPCVILHGLLGSSRNWLTVGKALARHFAVYALDARNHGESLHCDQMDYGAMVGDLEEWRESVLADRSFRLVGHSMGGKTAMRYACTYPNRVEALVVVDIAVRAYKPRWEKEFAAMLKMPLTALKSRSEAENWLESEGVSDWAFRKFLITNLERDESSGFRWTINLEVLQASLPQLFTQPIDDEARYDGPVLWLRGERSDFVTESDFEQIRKHFPRARIETINGAGHNVHFEQMQSFVDAVQSL
ncbi:MAG: alpha/beta fold hydrolase [Opitutales bacterium]|nr:alpha/beta fold hydrolase [Opitutales bacterium]